MAARKIATEGLWKGLNCTAQNVIKNSFYLRVFRLKKLLQKKKFGRNYPKKEWAL